MRRKTFALSATQLINFAVHCRRVKLHRYNIWCLWTKLLLFFSCVIIRNRAWEEQKWWKMRIAAEAVFTCSIISLRYCILVMDRIKIYYLIIIIIIIIIITSGTALGCVCVLCQPARFYRFSQASCSYSVPLLARLFAVSCGIVSSMLPANQFAVAIVSPLVIIAKLQFYF